MEKKLLISVFLASLLIVSGCIGGGGDKEEDKEPEFIGLEVSSFTSNFNDLQAGQTTGLKLNIKNIGSRRAEDIRAKLYHVPFGDCSSCWEILSTSPSCSELGSYWSCPSNLAPPDEETGFSGGKETIQWQVNAPDLQKGVNIPYKFYTRVYYNYKTISTTQFDIMTQERYNKKGSPSQGYPKADTSKGPLEVSIKSKEPAVIYQNQENIGFCVMLENKGEGTPFSNDVSPGEIETEDEGLIDLTVEFGNRGTQTDQVRIIKGEGMKCLSFDVSGIEISESVPITITANYGYYKDTSLSLNVEGR